jgi:hypothetical protein
MGIWLPFVHFVAKPTGGVQLTSDKSVRRLHNGPGIVGITR